MKRGALIAAASLSMACGDGETVGWQIFHAPIVDGMHFTAAHQVGGEIWVVGSDLLDDHPETTTIHFDGDGWARTDLELPINALVITARDSFWQTRRASSGTRAMA